MTCTEGTSEQIMKMHEKSLLDRVKDYASSVQVQRTPWLDLLMNDVIVALTPANIGEQCARRALEPFVALLDSYEEHCGEEGRIIPWVEFLSDYKWPSEQDCINARIALTAPPGDGWNEAIEAAAQRVEIRAKFGAPREIDVLNYIAGEIRKLAKPATLTGGE